MTDVFESEIERFGDRVEQGKAKLLRPDGERIYGESEHTARVGALLAEYDNSVDTIMKAAEAAAVEAEQAARDVSRSPMYAMLSDGNTVERGALATFHPFVLADARDMTLRELASELEAQAAGGLKTSTDRALGALWLHAANRRLSREQPRATADPDGNLRVRPHRDPDAFHALRVATEGLAVHFTDPRATAKTQAAQAARQRVLNLQMHAGQTRRNLDGTADRTREAMRAFAASNA